MFKGLIAGGGFGAVVAGAVLSVVSLVAGQPAGNQSPDLPLTDVPAVAVAAPDSDVSVPMVAPAVPPTETATAPVASVPAPEGTAPIADTAPTPQPDVQQTGGTLAPPAIGTAPDLGAQADAGVLPNPQGIAPQIPENEGDLRISTEPAQPLAPDAGALAGPTDEEFLVIDPPADTPVTPADGPVEAAETPEPAAPVVPIPETVALDPEPVPDAPVVEAEEAGLGDLAVDTEEAPPKVEPPPVVALAGNSAGAPAGGATGVRVVRPEPEAAEAEGDVLPDAIAEDTRPALERFGADFENTGKLPTLAIILVDDGSMPGGPEALAVAPFPVTVAISPGQADAGDLMAAYRDKGIEVLSILRLPEGAVPSDVEVALGAAFGTLPEAVGVIDIGEGGLKQDRAANEQVMAALAADGRGFVTVSKGLNTTLREAEAAGVPARVIFRDLDAEEQDARVIRRFLDQAAFRARQESGIVVLGRVRPDTISALILWGEANRAGQVAQAPVSAVLQE